MSTTAPVRDRHAWLDTAPAWPDPRPTLIPARPGLLAGAWLLRLLADTSTAPTASGAAAPAGTLRVCDLALDLVADRVLDAEPYCRLDLLGVLLDLDPPSAGKVAVRLVAAGHATWEAYGHGGAKDVYYRVVAVGASPRQKPATSKATTEPQAVTLDPSLSLSGIAFGSDAAGELLARALKRKRGR